MKATAQEINDAIDIAECCVHDQIKDPNERDHHYEGLKKVRALALAALSSEAIAGTYARREALNRITLVRQAILTVLDDANPRTPGLAWDFNDDEQRVDFADRVASFVPSALSEIAPRWIPVAERLPEIGRNVLVYTPKSERKVKALARFIPYEGAPDERGCWDNHYPGSGNTHVFTAVTHWQPLPEEPK